MKKIIIYILEIILIILIFIVTLMLLNRRVREYNIETAKMGVDWKTNTCYLYWE